MTFLQCNGRKQVILLVITPLITLFSFALAQAEATPTPTKPAKVKITTSPALIKVGQQIAKEKCGSCHAISKTEKSAHKEAPAFRGFSKKWPIESLEESLAEGIMTGHADMPEFKMTPKKITAFLAFLDSIQAKEKVKRGSNTP